jgi:hypothetical protein
MEKENNKNHWWAKFRKTELNLSVLLWLLVITIFIIYPVTDHGLFSQMVFVFFVCLIFISGIFSITHKKNERAIALTFSFLLLFSAIIIISQNHEMTNEIMLGIMDVYLLVLSSLLLKKVFSDDLMVVHRILGAIAVYILVALFFSFAYRIVFLIDNTSIHFHNIQNATGKAAPFEFMYFSFIILTTMGYGEVIPVGHYAQSLAMVESMMGILFPSVLIARLIGMVPSMKKE